MLYNTKKSPICNDNCRILCIFAPIKRSLVQILTPEMSILRNTFLLLPVLLITACSSKAADTSAGQDNAAQHPENVAKTRPAFCADSAYQYVADQCSFGPRVPGSEAQQQCAQWLADQLRRHQAEVSIQQTEAKAYDGTVLPIYNIVGSYNRDARMRVLLISHWDSRHVADNDPDPASRHQPVMGANDGASGVGVLLELARLASQQKPQVGFDIFLTDAEDYGAPDDWKGQHDEKWWALGTQLWCKEASAKGYRAQYGILLDMVGSPDATFYREYYSERYAGAYVNEIWQTAASLGYSDLFVDRQGGGITDDHVFVNRILGLPCVDIIDTRMDADGTFCPQWHTTHDTMEGIAPQTLGKVGNVLVKLLW